MKKLIFLVALLAVVSGCTWFSERKLDAQACLQDPVCREEAIKQAEATKRTVSDIAALSPVPAAGPIVGSVAGYIALIFAFLAGGAAIRKKKAETPPT